MQFLDINNILIKVCKNRNPIFLKEVLDIPDINIEDTDKNDFLDFFIEMYNSHFLDSNIFPCLEINKVNDFKVIYKLRDNIHVKERITILAYKTDKNFKLEILPF